MTFPTTRWTLLDDATLHGDDRGLEALNELCRRYQAPVLAFFRSKSLSLDDAQDLTQTFLLWMSQTQAWRRADASKGRFRTYVLSVASNVLRQWNKAGRGGAGGGSSDLESSVWLSEEEPDVDDSAALQFDREWAIATLAAAFRRVESEYALSAKKSPRFAVLRKFLPGVDKTISFEAAAKELGVSIDTLKTLIRRLRDDLSSALRAEVAATLAEGANLDNEMSHLLRVLTAAHGVVENRAVEGAKYSKLSGKSISTLRVPNLREIWKTCASLPKLHELVEIGHGFTFAHKNWQGLKQKQTSPVPLKGFELGFDQLGDSVMTHQLPPATYLNLTLAVRNAGVLGTSVGIPQVLLSEFLLHKGPWCVRAMIDKIGMAATKTFTICRWRISDMSLTALWAILSSPLANAFAFVQASKKLNRKETWEAFPVPLHFDEAAQNVGSPLMIAAKEYLSAVHSIGKEFAVHELGTEAIRLEALKVLLWRIDAEVLKLYALPLELEHQLLAYFADFKRFGVPFHQDRYFPAGFDVPLSLSNYLAITVDWETTNARRLALIQRKLEGIILTDVEQTELFHLKRLARAKSALVMPLPRKDEQKANPQRGEQ